MKRSSTLPYKRAPSVKKRRFTPYGRGRSVATKQGRTIAQSTFVTLRYATRITLNPTFSTPAYHAFRANSLFDPDLSGTGHQPMGFDQYMGFYNHYNVSSSKIKATAWSGASDATGTAIVGIRTGSSASTYLTTQGLLEAEGTHWVPMGGIDGGKSITTVNQSVDLSKYLGKFYMDDSNRGSDATNPEEDVIFQLFGAGVDTSTDPAPINYIVTIEFRVKFTEPRILTPS